MAAGRALGRPLLDKGDYQVSPTRRGLVYRNDLTLGPAEAFQWMPAGEANLLSFDAARRSFDCVSALRVMRPDGADQVLPLRPSANCSVVLPAAADVFLLASVAGPATSGHAEHAPRAGGLALLGAAAFIRDGTTRIELEWRVEAPPHSALAFIPRLKDASGALLLDSIFPSRGAKRSYPMIWPLVDDLASGLSLKRGRTLRQTFLLRRAPKALAPGAVLELDAFELALAGNAMPLGTMTVPLSVER